MKSLEKNAWFGFLAILMTLLVIAGCYEFDYVNQPGSAQPDSSFVVQISATTTSGDGNPYIPYFGIMLPVGWTVEDSIGYTCDSLEGTFVYSDSLSIRMGYIYCPPENYYWWVGAGVDSVIYNLDDTYLFNPTINTDGQIGSFYLSYMLGSSNHQGYGGLGNTISEDHLITVGLPEHIVVTSPASSGAGTLRQAIEDIDYYGTITFDLPDSDTIFLSESLKVRKSVTIEGAGTQPRVISGNHQTRIFTISGNSAPHLSELALVNGTGQFGGAIFCENSSPMLSELIIKGNAAALNGGGIYCDAVSNMSIQNGSITGNHARAGGAVYLENYSRISLSGTRIAGNMAQVEGGGLNLSGSSGCTFDSINRPSIHSNSSLNGDDLFAEGTGEVIQVLVDTFSVMNPTNVHASPISMFAFDVLHGKYDQVSEDVFVSPEGNNENSGLSGTDPFRTIDHAISVMIADSLHPHTIHLLEGTYSPVVNDEMFPVRLPDFISLEGTSGNDVILSPEGSAIAFSFESIKGNALSNFTITGSMGDGIICNGSNPTLSALTIAGNSGHGVSCSSSTPLILNLNVLNNGGAGIYCYNSDPVISNSNVKDNILAGIELYESSPEILNCNINDNGSNGITCNWLSNPVIKQSIISGNKGCGIFTDLSGPELQHFMIRDNAGSGISSTNSSIVKLIGGTVTGNHSYRGGGIECLNSFISFDSLNRCSIYSNSSQEGNDLYSDTYMYVIVDTFSVLYPNVIHAQPFSMFSFDILHGLMEQVDADLYVATDGSDSNSGIMASEPLRTLYKATSLIRADSLHHHTIFLEAGTYSASLTGETFPVVIPPYLNLRGISDSLVTLDAEEESPSVVHFPNNKTYLYYPDVLSANKLESVTITGGYSSGILCEGSNPEWSNLIVVDNPGTGISMTYSTPILKNCVISNNANHGIECNSSNPLLENVSITGNTAIENGGGMYCTNGSFPVLNDVTISGNSANPKGGNGGGIFLDGSITLDRVRINNNAASNGGGIYCEYSEHLMNNVTLNGNIASMNGGGMYGKSSKLNLNNVLISGNHAGQEGAGIYNNGQGSVLKNITLAGNTSSQDGSGMYWQGYPPEIKNAIFWNDAVREIYVYSQVHSNPPIKISYSNIQGGQEGIKTHYIDVDWQDGNLNEDPLFIGSGEHPFMLLSGSTCRNAGTPDTMGLFLPLTDLGGNPRIWEDRIDMGAYEWNNVGISDFGFRISDFGMSIYPNPCRDRTNIYFKLQEAARVKVSVFNNMGQVVDEPMEAFFSEGEHTVSWNPKELPEGIYLCRISTGRNYQTCIVIINR